MLKISMVCQGLRRRHRRKQLEAVLRLGHCVAQGLCRRRRARTPARVGARALVGRRRQQFDDSATRGPARPTIMAGGKAIRTRWVPICTAMIRCGCLLPCCRTDRKRAICRCVICGQPAQAGAVSFQQGACGRDARSDRGARQTSTNPAVCDAFTLVIIADGEAPDYPGFARPVMNLDAAHKDAHEIDIAAAELRKVVPNAGSYVSESNYFNPRGNRRSGARIIRSCGGQNEIRSRRTVLRPSRSGQRKLERGRVCEGGIGRKDVTMV